VAENAARMEGGRKDSRKIRQKTLEWWTEDEGTRMEEEELKERRKKITSPSVERRGADV